MLSYAIVFAASAGVAFIATPLVRRISLRLGWIDHPSDRKVHPKPTPTAGGLAIFAGVVAGLAVSRVLPSLAGLYETTSILDASLVVVSVTALIAGFFGGVTWGIVIVGVVNAMAATGKLAFESIVQVSAPDANRARAFTRFETRNQLAWVAAGLLAVIISPSDQVGFMLVGMATGLAAAYYLYSS